MNNRRDFLKKTAYSCMALTAACSQTSQASGSNTEPTSSSRGSQRLSIEQINKWEALHYGMFIHFGMSTFIGKEKPRTALPASSYAPDKLDVDQWVSVARDAGMKYAVLTTKHVAGHCLWPSQHTEYTVANSTNKTDVVEKFVNACAKKNVKPGFYYCSWDNYNRFGSQTPSDGGPWNGMNSFPKTQIEKLPPFTTSLYQNFQTAQLTELLNKYGPIMEMWIDIPGVLGRGYRTYLYNYLAQMQPDLVIMMNSGISDGSKFPVSYAWPSDLIAIEKKLPPPPMHKKWRTIEGKQYCLPGEICDTIGKYWFNVPGDDPKPDQELLNLYNTSKQRGVNLLLNVPPDKHGLIPSDYVQSLMRLRKNADL